MKYLSVCSGIEAASVAWEPLGMNPVAFSEIEPYACRVLARRFPDVPNLGDMTRYENWSLSADIDLLVGGTPCQAFSRAGLRKGLEDERGNLALAFCLIAQKFQPTWIVWENVPGVLSSNGGRDFGSIVGALAELGYGWAYRVLDAKYFGVPQQRRRVFLVGRLGDWRRAAEVLFEPESMSRDTSKSRQKELQDKRAPAFSLQECGPTTYARTLTSSNRRFDIKMENFLPVGDGVRRLTPLECERLQGFPDYWTLVDYGADTSRYQVIGNSMAVPVMRWIGQRILQTHTAGSTI